jgi:sulfur relay (sulfurtransferase) DsrC/TusE family protein
MLETQWYKKYRKAAVKGKVKVVSPKKHYFLFPSGIGKGICRMTDLPKPTGCM